MPPYLAKREGQGFKHGANFAVAGATALDAEFFYEQKIGPVLWTNSSLNVQLDWFKKLKSSLCSTKQGSPNSHYIIQFVLNLMAIHFDAQNVTPT